MRSAARNRPIQILLLAVALVGLTLPGASPVRAQDEPPLPPGLSPTTPAPSSEPALPPGLVNDAPSEEPALPPGLTQATTPARAEDDTRKNFRERLPFDLSGFWEARGGFRTRNDTHEKDASIGETRLQLKVEKSWDRIVFKTTGDFLYDPIFNDPDVDLEEGEGFFDLREANLLLRPASFLDVKIGRQVLTWGTGDLLFINDLFPKDWNSFFIGRDQEYLKAPSDAVKASLFTNLANLDVVYMPRFDSDRFIDGRRISYYNAAMGRRVGRNAKVKADRPDDWFDDNEIAVRLYRNLGTFEAALYAYKGFWKSPGGSDPVSGKAIFPELSVYGASLRGPIGKGIGNIEVGYYDSEDDRDGDNAFVRNGELRFLAGYEQEIGTDFTAGVQYYLEHLLDSGDYQDSLPPGMPGKDEDRHVFTLRLTKLLMNQNLKLSLFAYYCPTDEDAYFRPHVSYKVDDYWTVEAGGNLFVGDDDHTFFGQFENNSNLYVGVRYGF